MRRQIDMWWCNLLRKLTYMLKLQLQFACHQCCVGWCGHVLVCSWGWWECVHVKRLRLEPFFQLGDRAVATALQLAMEI